ncbi:FAD-dependent oxidoreductase, partial [Aphanothece microscopica]
MTEQQVPLAVWGGGTGGAAAAIQAARAGAPTLLLTPGAWLGGMVSAAGVCCPDGNELTPWQTGLWGALLRELARREPAGLDHNWVSCFGYAPATAEAVLRAWVAELPSLTWWPNCRLLGVRRIGARIEGLELERLDGEGRVAARVELRPRLVVDGSDRGELIGLAAAPHRLGWEPRELWQEPSAPAAKDLAEDPFFRRQPVQSPTWVAMGQLRQDRVCPAGAPSLREPFAQATAAFGLERTLTYGRLPGDRVMLNWPLHGNDWHRGLDGAFGDDAAREAELVLAMQEHSLAFAAALTEASQGWLELAEVFPRNGRSADLAGPSPLALMPYWREGRRLQGLSTVIEQDLLPRGAGAAIAPLPGGDGRSSAVAVGNYANDHHYPGPDWPLAAKSCRWGGRWSGTPFCIPYGALVSEAVVNLLAADKAISVSHMANGATRLQPLVLNLGQAAGMAAALCLQGNREPAELPLEPLQRALVLDPRAPAAPMPLWDTPWHHPNWRERQLAALEDPALLGTDGHLACPGSLRQSLGEDLLPSQAPKEPGEQSWRGSLSADGEGGYRLTTATDCWPVITLEP